MPAVKREDLTPIGRTIDGNKVYTQRGTRSLYQKNYSRPEDLLGRLVELRDLTLCQKNKSGYFPLREKIGEKKKTGFYYKYENGGRTLLQKTYNKLPDGFKIVLPQEGGAKINQTPAATHQFPYNVVAITKKTVRKAAEASSEGLKVISSRNGNKMVQNEHGEVFERTSKGIFANTYEGIGDDIGKSFSKTKWGRVVATVLVALAAITLLGGG